MNSLSQCNNDEKYKIYGNYYNCDKHCIHPVPGKSILRCSSVNFATNVNIIDDPPFVQNFNQPITSVTIDTTCLHCPSILIDFAGIITITPAISSFISTIFSFTLFKTCKESKVRHPLATYNFNIQNFFSLIADSQTIKFEYSPCDDQCEDCCTYTLEFTRASNIVFDPVSANISLSGTLCALAVDSPS